MNENKPEMNEAVMNQLRSYWWKGRVLTTVAFGVGLLSIGAGILLMWANAAVIFPEVNLMLQQSNAAKADNTNSTTIAGDVLRSLPDGTKVDSQTLLLLMQGKAMNVTSLAVTLLGVGTLLTLVLVIFNRRVTLRQINVSLAQISEQIKALQKSP
jgi:hypothetical protein